MKHIRLFLLLGALLCGALLVASCNKANLGNSSNPVAVSLPAADFGVLIFDHEHGYDRDSNYVFEGEWKDGAFRFGLDRTEAMVPNITPDNAITFRITSDFPSFQGVNASSSKGGINIVQDGNDHTVYHLEWVAEGESEIAFWNGEGEARKELKFKATSKKEIPLEGFKLRFGGVETDFMRIYATDYSTGPVIMPGVEPNKVWNTTASRTTRESDPDWTCSALYNEDWSKMQPAEVFPIPLNANTRVFIADIKAIGYILDEENAHKKLSYVELCDANIKNFPQFRWFDPTKVSANSSSSSKESWDEVYKNCPRVNPIDMRERRIIVPRVNNLPSDKKVELKIYLYSGNYYDFTQKEMLQYIYAGVKTTN